MKTVNYDLDVRIDYTNRKLTEVGMIMFQVLYQVMGGSDFNKCIRTYCSDYYLKGATTYEFVVTAKKESATKFSKFCWLQVYRFLQ